MSDNGDPSSRSVARLLAEIANLTRRVGRLETGQGTGDTDTAAHIAELSTRLAELTGRVDALAAADEEAPEKVGHHWPDIEAVDPTEHERRWLKFTAWVDDVLRARYPDVPIKPEWEDNPSAVDALTAAWLAWLHAYRNPQAKGTDPATWQRDTLPALTRRLEQLRRARR